MAVSNTISQLAADGAETAKRVGAFLMQFNVCVCVCICCYTQQIMNNKLHDLYIKANRSDSLVQRRWLFVERQAEGVEKNRETK